jgi:ATP-dependent Clp protease adaptor protein ClpS
MGTKIINQNEAGVQVKKAKARVKPPSMYRVYLKNDDYTPMDFVVEVLQKFFYMPPGKAIETMLIVHRKGKAVCGVFTFDIAETKVSQVNQYAAFHDHPLLCGMEPD